MVQVCGFERESRSAKNCFVQFLPKLLCTSCTRKRVKTLLNLPYSLQTRPLNGIYNRTDVNIDPRKQIPRRQRKFPFLSEIGKLIDDTARDNLGLSVHLMGSPMALYITIWSSHPQPDEKE